MNPSGAVTSARMSKPADRPIEAPELIDRLAEKLRASSDVDLPHSYFVEQVRLGLGGADLTDHAAANAVETGSHRGRAAANQSVFNAWARPD